MRRALFLMTLRHSPLQITQRFTDSPTQLTKEARSRRVPLQALVRCGAGLTTRSIISWEILYFQPQPSLHSLGTSDTYRGLIHHDLRLCLLRNTRTKRDRFLSGHARTSCCDCSRCNLFNSLENPCHQSLRLRICASSAVRKSIAGCTLRTPRTIR